MRKVDIVISGEVLNPGKILYKVPRSKPLTFYISSLASFVDNSTHYLTKVIERRAEAETACYVAFASGSDNIDPRLDNNTIELNRIKSNIASLVDNRTYDIDSIIVSAYASPEGNRASNELLTRRRSKSISNYFDKYIKYYKDRLIRERGVFIDAETQKESSAANAVANVNFISRSAGENWEMLDHLVETDSTMKSIYNLKTYYKLRKIKDIDLREQKMQDEPWYMYIRQNMYPQLRIVSFDFHLHRRGMEKDTIHTTIVDTTYMKGVKAIIDRDYKMAIKLLGPYHDYNLAVAYASLDYNASALDILEKIPNTKRSPEVKYMLAVIYSRIGKIQEAVQLYLESCREKPAMTFRGNLDPEISALIKNYGLNNQNHDNSK